jgi:hypothetical protein
MTEDSGFDSLQCQGFISSPQRPNRLHGSPSFLSSDIKQPVLEADHSPPAGAEVKNMGWMSRVQFSGLQDFFTSPRRPDRLWGPPSLLSNGYLGLPSTGVKRQGREADRSPPASAEVKNMGWMSRGPFLVFQDL